MGVVLGLVIAEVVWGGCWLYWGRKMPETVGDTLRRAWRDAPWWARPGLAAAIPPARVGVALGRARERRRP